MFGVQFLNTVFQYYISSSKFEVLNHFFQVDVFTFILILVYSLLQQW